MHTAFYSKLSTEEPVEGVGNTGGSRLHKLFTQESLKEGFTHVWIDNYEGLFIRKGLNSVLQWPDVLSAVMSENLHGFSPLHLNLHTTFKDKALQAVTWS